MIINSVGTASAGGRWPALPHDGGVHGFETAARCRGNEVPNGFRRVADMDINVAGGQLAGGNAGGADFALGRTGFVLKCMQRKHALCSDEQGGKKQAWQ